MEIVGKYTTAAVYTEQIEDYAVAQIKQLCDQKAFERCRIAVMPDVHPGKVGPIGFTSTLGEMVMPAVVGIDIGCGMTMAKLKRTGNVEFQKLDKVIVDRVPSGFAYRKTIHRFAEEFDFERLRCIRHVNVERAKSSMGTLGGGNHFIELDRDEDKNIYCVIHSGSRHLGKEVAEYYMKAGQAALKERGIETVYELTWLDGTLKEDYLADMAVAQEFAEENRRTMLDEILKGMKWKAEEVISCIHNYVDFSGNIPMMRKGAISAKEGEKIIIPINMKDGILLGVGLGNENWNNSAPHGAGRIANREKIRETFTVSQFKKEMQGIYSSCIGTGTLDEAPFAYRRIDELMPLLTDTVRIEKVLEPIYNFKAQGKK